jgi:hypothetical protein
MPRTAEVTLPPGSRNSPTAVASVEEKARKPRVGFWRGRAERGRLRRRTGCASFDSAGHAAGILRARSVHCERGSMVPRLSCRVCCSRACHLRLRAAAYRGAKGPCACEQSRESGDEVLKGDAPEASSRQRLDARNMMANLESRARGAAFTREANVDWPLRRTIQSGLQTLPQLPLKMQLRTRLFRIRLHGIHLRTRLFRIRPHGIRLHGIRPHGIRLNTLPRMRAAGATCGGEPRAILPPLKPSSGKRTPTGERGIERLVYDGPPLAAGVLERRVLRSSS